MAKTDILDYSPTPAENQDINGVSILGTAKPSNLDDAQRAQMSHIAKGLVSRRSAKDTAYTAVKADHNQVLDFTETATLTTQAAVTLTDGWMCYVYASGGNVTINPNGAETVNGEEFIVVKEGGLGILRVYDGNFLFSGFTTTGGQTSEIIHEEATTTLSSTSTRDITDIAEGFRAIEIEGEISSLSNNPGTVHLVCTIGSSGLWATLGGSRDDVCLARWTAGTTARRFLTRITNLDEAALSVIMRTDFSDGVYPGPQTGYNFAPSSFASRPINALRISALTSTGTCTVNIAKLRVRGIRA
jgi:hypothetical protein